MTERVRSVVSCAAQCCVDCLPLLSGQADETGSRPPSGDSEVSSEYSPDRVLVEEFHWMPAPVQIGLRRLLVVDRGGIPDPGTTDDLAARYESDEDSHVLP